jgi:hypothetical protein
MIDDIPYMHELYFDFIKVFDLFWTEGNLHKCFLQHSGAPQWRKDGMRLSVSPCILKSQPIVPMIYVNASNLVDIQFR